MTLTFPTAGTLGPGCREGKIKSAETVTGADLGKNCGARGTFWNIRTAKPQHYPPASFGLSSMNLVAVQTEQSTEKNVNGRWFEAIAPDKIEPQDIHASQLAPRLKQKTN